MWSTGALSPAAFDVWAGTMAPEAEAEAEADWSCRNSDPFNYIS